MKTSIMPLTPSELIEHVQKQPNGYYVVDKKSLIKSTFDLYKFIATLRSCHWDFVGFDRRSIFFSVNGRRELMWGVYDLQFNMPSTCLICASTSYQTPCAYIFSRKHIEELIKKMERS